MRAYPPRPMNISIPAVVAGNILQNDDTSISAIDNGFDGSIVMKTQNTLAMLINPNQHVSINTEAIDESMFTINNDSSSTSTFRLSYQDSFYFDGRVLDKGTALFVPSCDDVALNAKLTTMSKKNFDITDHDGMSIGLRLGGTLVTASASELNFVDVPIGTATPSKALVVDSTKSITGITQLDAQRLTGTLLTSNQPNITSLNNIDIQGNLKLNGQLFTLTQTQMGYVQFLNEGVAYPSKAVILDPFKNITGINSLRADKITGTLAQGAQPNVTSLTGLTNLVNTGTTTLQGATTIISTVEDQLMLKTLDDKWTSIVIDGAGAMVLKAPSSGVKIQSGNLYIQSHNGATSGLYLNSSLVIATADQLNYTRVTPGAAAPFRAMVLDSALTISGVNQINTAFMSGTLLTSAQPNISSVRAIDITSHNGSSIGLALNGVLVTASASQINFVNTTPGSVQASKALIADSSKNITGINTLTASSITGTLTTSLQPNITRVNTINGVTGLTLGSTLVTASAAQINQLDTEAGTVYANKVLIADGSLNIVGFNILKANTLAGTLTTPYQPNINRVDVLNISTHDGTKGLSLNGTLVTASAAQLNRLAVDAGTANLNKALVVDSAMSISGINILNANTLGGVLSTAYQPNITQVKTLNIGNHDVLITSTADQLNYVNVNQGIEPRAKAIILDSARDIRNIGTLTADRIIGIVKTAEQPLITKVNTLNIATHDGSSNGLSLNGTLITATADQINRLNTSPGSAAPNKPNITSIQTLDIAVVDGVSRGLSFGGALITASANQINRINTSVGTAAPGKALILDTDLSISNINSLSANQLTGTLQTASQPNITSVKQLNITNHNGTTGLQLNGMLVLSTATQINALATAPGSANALHALVTDEFNSIVGINNFSATKITASCSRFRTVTSKAFSQNEFTIYNTTTSASNTAKFIVDTGGDLTIDASGNNVTFGSGDSINIPAHNGTTTGLYLGGVLVQPTAYELNYLKVSPGTATPSHAVVIDASSSITGINSLTATSISCTNLTSSAFTINNLSLSGLLNNFNSGGLLVRQISGPDVSGRVIDVNVIDNINLINYDPKNLNSYYSLGIIGYVLPSLTDNYYFHAIANDRVRIWVNHTLILNLWDTAIGTESTSLPIALVAGQWTPIYIQFQNIVDNSSLQVRWSASTLVKSQIPSGSMAWDNTVAYPIRPMSITDKLTIFSHNGSTTGLQLSGGLVKANASELNYLAGATPER
ncbi:PA14 domain [Phytophthora cactorum]|nr:PA14 domain [Phytophthora cactorum]